MSGSEVGLTGRLGLRTRRLLLRCWRSEDAVTCKAAIDASLEHLRPWMAWAHEEPSTLDVIAERLARFERNFVEGRDWVYGCFAADRGMMLGGVGLHPRRGPGILEIGYWLRPTETGRGFATEAAAALTRCAVERHGVRNVQIRCDPRNVASARVPQRLGFRLRERLTGVDTTHDGRPRDTLVWEMVADEITPQWTAAHPVAYEEEDRR